MDDVRKRHVEFLTCTYDIRVLPLMIMAATWCKCEQDQFSFYIGHLRYLLDT